MSGELLDYATNAPGRERFSEITVPAEVFHNLATGYASPHDIGHINNWNELLTHNIYHRVVDAAISYEWNVSRHLPGLGDALNGARHVNLHEFRQAWSDPYLNGLVARYRQKSLELGPGQPPSEQIVTRIITEMGAAAAAAAIRCNLPRFEVYAHAGDQMLTLPSLGALRLPGPAAGVAVTKDSAGKILVTSETGNFESELPVDLHTPTPQWRPLTRLTSTHNDHHFSVVLDDVAPNRRLFVPGHLDTLTEADRASWHRQTDPMWHTLVQHFPGDALSIASLIRTIVPLEAPVGEKIGTYSNIMANAMLGLSLPTSPVRFAQELLHEYQHNILVALSRVAQLGEVMRYDDNERFWAPWRFDARPLDGLTHGLKAHTHIARFCQVMMDAAPTSSERRMYAIEFARWRAQVGQAFGVLSDKVREPKGHDAQLLGGLHESVSDLFDVSIEERYVSVARDELDYNHGIWRLANTKIDPAEVRELADIFLASLLTARLPASDVQGALTSAVSESVLPALLASMRQKANNYTTLPAADFIDPAEATLTYYTLDKKELFDLYQDKPEEFESLCRNPSGLSAFRGALPADLHLIRGDYSQALAGYAAHIQQRPEDKNAWPGFLVAYARTREDIIQPNSAEQALLGRPEILQALYSHVSRQCTAAGQPAFIKPEAFLWELAHRLPIKSPWN